METKEYLNKKFSKNPIQKCWMCGCDLTRLSATVDHLQPKSKGGKDRENNYRLACKPCNNERGNKMIPKSLRLKLKGKERPKKIDYSMLAKAIKLLNQTTIEPQSLQQHHD